MSILPELIKEKIKNYEYLNRWKEQNLILIKNFKQKTCFLDDHLERCDQESAKYLGYYDKNSVEIEGIVDLHNDEIQRFSYSLNHYIFNFINGRRPYFYKSKKHFYSSGCNCSDRLCKDIMDCPTN